jgi:RNA-directed DNA polymerase
MVKRANHLFEQVYDFQNLRQALHRTLKRKRGKSEARCFVANLDHNLHRLADQIKNQTLQLGQSHQFMITDPKQRLITAPCFRERVLHHAIVRVCERVFERWLIDDTYACRRGKGRIAALQQAQYFANRFPFFLKLDVRQYFPSVSHVRLEDLLKRLFKEPRLLALWKQVIASHAGDQRRGLPIGSLTSQHLANAYLGQLDRFVKEGLRVKGYLRYMDDMVLWGNNSAVLKEQLRELETFLDNRLELQFKASPYINKVAHGLDFLGARIFAGYLIPSRSTRIRYRRKVQRLERGYKNRSVTELELQQRVTAMTANLRVAGMQSWRWRRGVVDSYPGE